MTVVVGVDAGGSHAEALLAVDGTPVARQLGAPGAILPGGVGQAARVIGAVVAGLMERAAPGQVIEALVVGAAGAGREAHRSGLEAALRTSGMARRVSVITDGEVALQSAFGEEPGIVLTAGTGSLALARTPNGELRRAGGHGWRVGDEGSGYALARAGVAAAARAVDGRGPATSLTASLPRAAGAADVPALLEWARTVDVPGLSALATTVLESAASGDLVARALVGAASQELAAHIHALLAFFPAGHGAAVALAGSLLAEGSGLRTALLGALEPDSGRLLLANVKVDPALGAVELAWKLLTRR
ncbi:MAG TPA: BadF/BadG/BcrA/BcrD ATPase family protein [Gemmatimonadales bacterium]|nr:BadF/BadG/BcrA/BcrD ATPase family protein [Gemmatimonadales bacterium]